MLKEFRAFITRGNVIDLAVAVVIGVAFGAVITALVADIITPIVGIAGHHDFSSLSFTVNKSKFLYGDFINALIAFLSVAAAIFFLVIKPINALQARKNRGAPEPDPTTQQCPECLSDIPIAATRCAFCTVVVRPANAAVVALGAGGTGEVPPVS